MIIENKVKHQPITMGKKHWAEGSKMKVNTNNKKMKCPTLLKLTVSQHVKKSMNELTVERNFRYPIL